MIRAARTEHNVSFEGAVPAGAIAFVDADWIGEDGPARPVCTLVVAEATVRLGIRSVPLPGGVNQEAAARACLVDLARRAVAATGSLDDASVAVAGRGFAATVARAMLGTRLQGAGSRPSSPTAVIDFAGRSSCLEDSLRTLAPLGTLVLAGERTEAPMPLNMYRDAHVRGLRLIGITPSLPTAEVLQRDAEGDSILPSPKVAPLPSASLPLAAWYRLTSASAASPPAPTQ